MVVPSITPTAWKEEGCKLDASLVYTVSDPDQPAFHRETLSQQGQQITVGHKNQRVLSLDYHANI